MRCLHCGKKTNRPKFCCNKHRYKYHNMHNPRGRYAYLAYLKSSERTVEDDMHPQDPYSLGQE
jgi:hypothetical protein